MATTNIQICFASHSRHLEPNAIIRAITVSRAPNSDTNFLPILYTALANFPVALADNPVRFSLAHFLNLCNLVMSSSFFFYLFKG